MSKNNNHPRFCQFCGSQDIKSDIEESGFKCNRCNRTVYLNSKPSACAAIIRDNHVLLVRAVGTQKWDLPGGFLLYGESPEDGIKRELMEELQVKVEVERLLIAIVDVYGTYNEYSLNLFYKVSLISDEIKPGAEIEEIKWFDINRLPHIKYKSTSKLLTNLSIYTQEKGE